ncbi:hypothetical protein QCD70_13935 [Agreia sp. PsM10]|nr:hypothetical protein [Agreia sp. PsM10]MDN4641353.1 hypothetical protein [Agreia sp. PsM10]
MSKAHDTVLVPTGWQLIRPPRPSLDDDSEDQDTAHLRVHRRCGSRT